VTQSRARAIAIAEANVAMQNIAHGGHATPEECPVCGAMTVALDFHLTIHKPYREPWWLRLLRWAMRSP
jgi:hypothetical protein